MEFNKKTFQIQALITKVWFNLKLIIKFYRHDEKRTIGIGAGVERGWGPIPTQYPKTFSISEQERNKQSRISFCIVI